MKLPFLKVISLKTANKSQVKMENGGYIDEVIRKCSLRKRSKSPKKKTSDSIVTSTLKLMKRISSDGEIDMPSLLKSAIIEEDLSTVR